MTDQEFAELWNRSRSTLDVADATGQSKQGAIVKACRLRRRGLRLKKMPTVCIRPLTTRFWEHVEKTDACWNWTGCVDVKGYGSISTSRGSRPLQAHRVSYQIANGPIPDGMMVLHRCDNPRCVNPSHLFLGTAADNTHDMMSKERGHWQRKAPRHNWRRRTLLKERILLEQAKRELVDL